ncbi:uncharacterized protein LOC120329197 [Styela clava]
MKIPIRHSFIGLILLMEACLLIKGEECWIPMVCDDQPTWRELTKGQCTKEEGKALEALTERLDGMKSELNQLEKVLEEAETNSVVGVQETTTPHGYKDKKTSSARTSTVPATTPWSTKEAFLSTFRPQTTKVEQSTGYKNKKTSSARTSTVPATSPWSTKEAFLSTFRPQTTKVEQSTGYKDKKTSSARTSTVPATSPWSTKEAFLSTFRPQTTKVEQSTDILRYDGRIFIPLASEMVLKASAIAKCQQLGGELANIYTQMHMDKIMTFIRDNKLDGQSFKAFHLGMIYDPIDQILRLQNGTVTSHSVFKWYQGAPYNGQSHFGHTNMFIVIGEDSTSRYQYILNNPDLRTYVLCEV